MIVFSDDPYSRHLSDVIEPIFMICRNLNDDKSLETADTPLDAAMTVHKCFETFDEGFVIDATDRSAMLLGAPFAEIAPSTISVNHEELLIYLYNERKIKTKVGLVVAMRAILRLLNFNEQTAWERGPVMDFIMSASADLKEKGVKNVDIKFSAVTKKFCDFMMQRDSGCRIGKNKKRK